MSIEPSRWIPIGVSLLAIVISCLSWWESHRGRIINEEINRPILAINGITTSPSAVLGSGEAQIIIWLTIKLKNSGKATAIVDKPRVEPFLLFQTDDCKMDDSEFMQSPQNLEILQGSEEAVMRRVAIAGSGCEKRTELSLGLRLVIGYTDAGSGKQYFQDLLGDVVDIPLLPKTKQSQPKPGQRRAARATH